MARHADSLSARDDASAARARAGEDEEVSVSESVEEGVEGALGRWCREGDGDGDESAGVFVSGCCGWGCFWLVAR